ncbi:MAG: GNAT family N-acetyltransferase [Mariprofundaceae bacterium]|nr:GNAT family N-acetyltransferase [Mariprofundaceae bacterium]
MFHVKIRRACADDFAAVYALNCASFAEAWSEDGIRGVLSGGFDVWLAVHNDALCGYLFSCDVVDEIHIMQIAIAESWRKQGIAVRLSQTLLQDKPVMACALLELRRSNRAARCLYERLGFDVCGQRKNYYSASNGMAVEDAILMRLTIRDDHE